MSTDASAAQESAATTHGIDQDRYKRAITADMTIEYLGPSTYEAESGDETYGVDLEGVHCTCPDHEYRDARCKHLIRSALHAAFTEGVRTRFTAAVVRAADDYGCADDYHACGGPAGDTYPCPVCVAGTNTGDWTIWSVLIDNRPAREVTPDAAVDTGEGIATDGGVATTEDDDSGYNHTPSIEARANTRAVAWRNRRLKDRIESVAGERPAEVHDGRRRVTVRFEHVDEDMMAALSEAFDVQSVGISKREKIRGDERTVTRYDVLYLDSVDVEVRE